MDLSLGVIVGLAVGTILWHFFSSRRLTVMEQQAALKYSRGRLVKVLGPGRYTCLRGRTQLVILDLAPQWLTIPGQEILCADNLPVKITAVCKYKIGDPEKTALGNYMEELYNVLQLALRDRVSGLKLEEILQNRSLVQEGLAQAASDSLAALGLEIIDARVKDIMLSNDLKKAYSEVAKARQQGLAALEKARGETAALRNLANAARMLEDSPTLFKLRLLQSAADSGNSVVINTEKD